MPAFASALICVPLGLALLFVVARAFRGAVVCGDVIVDRFTRVHCPLLACVLGASAAVSWVLLTGADGSAGWHFTLTHASIVAGLALGGALLLGRDASIPSGVTALFWAGSILAMLTVASRRITMLEAQAMFLAGLVVVWSGLPRIVRLGPGNRIDVLPRWSVVLAYLLAIATGIAAYSGSQSDFFGPWVHGWLILLAAALVILPAILGVRGAMGSPLWFGVYASLMGLCTVPIVHALGTGTSGALASRAGGNPYWWVLLSESLALNIYTGGSVVLLPDAYALVVLAMVCLFVCLSSQLVKTGSQADGALVLRGVGWRVLGGATGALAITYWVVRSGSF